MEATIRVLYNVIWGQCSKLMKNKLKESPIFEEIDLAGDVAELLKAIWVDTHQKKERTNIYEHYKAIIFQDQVLLDYQKSQDINRMGKHNSDEKRHT